MLDAIQRCGSASRILWGCALAALLTACSGGASSNSVSQSSLGGNGLRHLAKRKLAEISGAFCSIDATNKTVRVALWDGKAWRKNSVKAFAWDDQTRLVSGNNELTMAQFIGGKPLDDDAKDIDSIRGERGVFQIDSAGGKDTVRAVEMMWSLNGEHFTLAAEVGNDGVVIPGHVPDNKVDCKDW